jgi:Cu/Ag efflux protein CusF
MRIASKWVGALAAIVLLAGTAGASDALAIGKIKSVNAEKKQFVLTGDGDKNHTFTLGENVVINRADQEGKFTDLKEGDEVSVLYDKGVVTWTAEYILVHEGDNKKARLARGSVKTWDPKKEQLTLTGLDNKDFTFEVGMATKVQLAGKATKIDDLKLGDKATVIYERDGDKMTIKQLMASRK